jgi:UDP-3-O-[3-hydroxymyristoyl] glucosamine N-acyltransferase
VPHSLQALAQLVGGTVKGDGTVQITGGRSVAEATPGDITFAEDERYAKRLQQCRAAAAVVGLNVESDGLPLIRVAKPFEAFLRIIAHLQGPKRQVTLGIHPQASIAPTARLGTDSSIGPFVMIGEDVTMGDRCRLMAGAVIGDGCRLGDDVVLHPHAVLYAGTVVGHRVTIHAGAVVGADGFGYRFQGDHHAKIPQLGHVELGDDVEIGANTTIDRATFDVTRIGAGSKIDNLVQVAHNCQIGRHNLLVSQAGIAGSSTTGDYVVIAGQAGIRDHLTIGEGAVIGAMSGVMRDVQDGERVVGIPATEEREQVRIVASVHRLPELRDKFKQLVKQVEEIGAQLAAKTRAA